jgi:hypothetical protein
METCPVEISKASLLINKSENPHQLFWKEEVD